MKPKKKIVVDPSDMTPTDLGGGWKLVFQRSTTDATKVRAVIKNPSGAVFARGDVVPEKEAFHSRLTALHNSKLRNWCSQLGLPPNATADQQEEALAKSLLAPFVQGFGGPGVRAKRSRYGVVMPPECPPFGGVAVHVTPEAEAVIKASAADSKANMVDMTKKFSSASGRTSKLITRRRRADFKTP